MLGVELPMRCPVDSSYCMNVVCQAAMPKNTNPKMASTGNSLGLRNKCCNMVFNFIMFSCR